MNYSLRHSLFQKVLFNGYFLRHSYSLFFCNTALTSAGWVRSTVLSFLHCPLALSTALSINAATEKISGAVIQTRAGWAWSLNATSVLCRPPNSATSSILSLNLLDGTSGSTVPIGKNQLVTKFYVTHGPFYSEPKYF